MDHIKTFFFSYQNKIQTKVTLLEPIKEILSTTLFDSQIKGKKKKSSRGNSYKIGKRRNTSKHDASHIDM